MLYELHLTTDPQVDLNAWTAECDWYEVKPLLIELEEGEHPRQVMTASTFEGTDDEAAQWAAETRAHFEHATFPIQRVKLEVPLDKAGPYEDFAYHEAHIKCLLEPDEVAVNIENATCKGWAASRNGLFKSDGGLEKWYFTKRAYGIPFLDAGEYFMRSFALLNLRGTVRMEKETVLSDSLPSLDTGWV